MTRPTNEDGPMDYIPAPFLPAPIKWFLGTVERGGKLFPVSIPAVDYDSALDALTESYGQGTIEWVLDGILLPR